MTLDDITQILGSDQVADTIALGSQGITACQLKANSCVSTSQIYLSHASAHLALASYISHQQRISKLTQDLEAQIPTGDSSR